MSIKMKGLYILSGMLPGALAFWINAYNDPSVWGIDQKIILLTVALVSAFFARYLGKDHTTNTAAFVSIGIMSAFLLRVVYDTTFVDKSHHNLLPLSFLLYAILTVPTAFLGSFAAKWFERKKQNT